MTNNREGKLLKNLLGIFFKAKDKDADDFDEYFECEDSVESALIWLDHHPNVSLEEYEAWLAGRDDAIAKIKLSKSEYKSRSYI